MNKKSMLGIVLGISLVVITSWIFLIVPEFKNNPSEFEQIFELHGINNVASDVGGELVRVTSTDNYEIRISRVNGNTVNLSGTVQVYDTLQERYVYNNTSHYSVDKNTKMLTGKNILFKFPNNSQKQNYTIHHPVVEQIADFTFENVENIDGLETYVYSYKSKPLDSTGNLPAYDGYDLTLHQTGRSWIEPITGTEVGFEMFVTVYAEDNKESVLVTEAFSHMSEYSQFVSIQNVKDKKNLFLIYDTIIPIFLIFTTVSISIGILVTQTLGIRTKELEQSKKEKFEILGKLSSRLAHDLRNPLTVIQVTLENLKSTYEEHDTNQKYFDKIGRSISRMTHQIDDVLGFVRGQPVTLDKVSMSEIIQNTMDSLTIPDVVTMILPKNNIELICDKRQFVIGLNNLILNGIQAIEGKGTIEITGEENKDFTTIRVKDSGTGISKHHINNIFEPLFTTKMQGTGLGLSGVKSIIEAHGGTISVTSPPTIFTITLPKTSN